MKYTKITKTKNETNLLSRGRNTNAYWLHCNDTCVHGCTAMTHQFRNPREQQLKWIEERGKPWLLNKSIGYWGLNEHEYQYVDETIQQIIRQERRYRASEQSIIN